MNKIDISQCEKKISHRKYGLDDNEVVALKEEWTRTGVFPCPYKRRGPYRGLVQALINLGVDNWHPFLKVRDEMKVLMTTMKVSTNQNVWDTFTNRKCRNSKSGKDLTGKIIQNALVLQRVSGEHKYGEKLRQMGVSLHAKKENGIIYFMLNTKTLVPSKIGI